MFQLSIPGKKIGLTLVSITLISCSLGTSIVYADGGAPIQYLTDDPASASIDNLLNSSQTSATDQSKTSETAPKHNQSGSAPIPKLQFSQQATSRISQSQAASIVQQALNGKILDVKLGQYEGRNVYLVKTLIEESRVQIVAVDRISGQIVQ